MSTTRHDTHAGQDGIEIRADRVTVFCTELGGMMTASFRDGDRDIRPYFVSPWQEEGQSIDEPVLVPLRGDFFCLPFGGGTEADGTVHPAHGVSAGGRWSVTATDERSGATTIRMEIAYDSRRIVRKEIEVRDGAAAIYSTHTIEGFDGAFPLGHHATLRADEPGDLLVSFAPFAVGRTAERSADLTATSPGEYYTLAPGRGFCDLTEVPTIWSHRPTRRFDTFPNEEGFVDIAGVYRPTAGPHAPAPQHPAWSCAVNPREGWLWFSLKDPRYLPGTVLWAENRGRHGDPWRGRTSCLGIEETCSYLAEGLTPSLADNPLLSAGVPTAVRLRRDAPTRVRYIQGAVALPDGFGRVVSAGFEDAQVVFVDGAGQKVGVAVDWRFAVKG